MCGISGFNWSDQELIMKMTKEISHRGPDDSGYYVDDFISLGHRRLSIIDLSSKGHQPMFDKDEEIIIVHNGEIYNYRKIKNELEKKGYIFKSRTDTEVILNAYKEWGYECIKRFIGMFAFAIYDKKKKIIFLVRDHIGIKPFYYYKDEKRFLFSSTIPPILIHDIKTAPNKRLIRDLLLYNNTDHTDETFFKNIMKFPKGHYAIYDIAKKKLMFYKWWENRFTGDFSGNYEEAVKELRELMIKSVNRRLLSEVPVGTCLSGGIDSSSIACLINKSKRSEIKTFSVVFPGFSLDESEYINIISSKTGMENYKIIPSTEGIKQDLFDFIKNIGEPIPGPSPYSQYNVFKLARNNDVTVLLDGQGGDELFAGYHYFYGFYIKGLFKKGKFIKAFKEISGLFKSGHFKLGFFSLGFLFVPLFIRRYYFSGKSNICESLLKDKEAETPFFNEYYGISSLHDSLKFHLDYKLEQLLKWEDRNSMAYSREARVPFLDIDVMRFVFRLPEDFIISQGKTKTLLRDAMDGIVPNDILDRRDKIGFASPEDDWLREEILIELLEDWFIGNEPLCRNYIDLKKTRKMIKQHVNNKRNFGRTLWRSVFLEAWFKVFQNRFGVIG